VATLYQAGLRNTELYALDVDDIDFEDGGNSSQPSTTETVSKLKQTKN